MFRQKTVEIFDTLFVESIIKPKNVDSALRIDRTMKKLQNLIPESERTHNARNIAYAEVTTAAGSGRFMSAFQVRKDLPENYRCSNLRSPRMKSSSTGPPTSIST